jgi:hypothetical protein
MCNQEMKERGRCTFRSSMRSALGRRPSVTFIGRHDCMAFLIVGFWFSHGVAKNLNDWNQGHTRELFLAPCTVEEASPDAG